MFRVNQPILTGGCKMPTRAIREMWIDPLHWIYPPVITSAFHGIGHGLRDTVSAANTGEPRVLTYTIPLV